MQHRAHRHEEQRLVENMSECVRSGAVQRKLRADPYADHHETELVVQTVCQDPAQIVLDDRKKDRERRHQRPDPDEQIGPRITASQRVDGKLGGKGRKYDGAGRGRFRVSVLKPVMKQGKCALNAEGDQNQHATHTIDADVIERNGPRLLPTYE